MDVIIVVFREAQVQPPKKVGDISDIVQYNDAGIGSVLNGSVGEKIVQIRCVDLDESIIESLKNEQLKLVSPSKGDPMYNNLLSGFLITNQENLMTYIELNDA